MSNQSFYFINHSRKEFSCFKNNTSIANLIKEALKNNIGWSEKDDIRVCSEITDEQTCIKYFDDMRYKIAPISKYS